MAVLARRRVGKRAVSVTVDRDLLEWVEEHVGVGLDFASISHAVERGLVCLKDQMEQRRKS